MTASGPIEFASSSSLFEINDEMLHGLVGGSSSQPENICRTSGLVEEGQIGSVVDRRRYASNGDLNSGTNSCIFRHLGLEHSPFQAWDSIRDDGMSAYLVHGRSFKPIYLFRNHETPYSI
jgi:hypothetical protein